ncbi:vitamin K epoxide reductase family protein [soil metagenome]
MTDVVAVRRPLPLAIVLIVTGAIGWYASGALTLDKLAVLANPEADLDCNFSLIVQCGVNLGSWQGAILGFPNPIIGLGGFVAPIAVGVALLAGAQFARWFWIAFNVGVLGAFAFILWLAYQSIFNLGTLCPWCMLVWSIVIPMFWTLTLSNARSGVFGSRLESIGDKLYGWVPAITLAGYLIIAIVAQVRLDVITHLTVG